MAIYLYVAVIGATVAVGVGVGVEDAVGVGVGVEDAVGDGVGTTGVAVGNGIYTVAFPPYDVTLAIPLKVPKPLNVVKSPTHITLPVDCNLISFTFPLNPEPTLNDVSIVPLLFNLIKLFELAPLYPVKSPPHNILPSDCNIILLTSPPNENAPVKPDVLPNVVSNVPFEFNLKIPFLV